MHVNFYVFITVKLRRKAPNKRPALSVALVVMGHVISTGLEVMSTGTSTRVNERLASAVRRTVELANSQDISPRERLHVKAMELFSRG